MKKNKDFVGIKEGFFVKARFGLPFDTRRNFLENEAKVLGVLSTKKVNNSFCIPRLKNHSSTMFFTQLTIEKIDGKIIDDLTPTQYLHVMNKTIDAIHKISAQLNEEDIKSLKKFSTYLLPIKFVINATLATLKYPKKIFFIIPQCITFFKNYLQNPSHTNDTQLCHLELYPDSILVNNKGKLFLVDWEATRIGNEILNVSDISRLFSPLIPIEANRLFVKPKIKSKKDSVQFLYLSIYRSIETIAHSPKDSHISKISWNYLHDFLPPVKTLYELIHPIILKCVYYMNKYLKLDKLPTPAFILCYHSVINSDWRYSTSPKNFASHLEILKKRFTPQTLTELISNNASNRFAITFDDAYQDLSDFALNELQKKDIPSTIFALGEPDLANRNELDNQHKLMTAQNLKEVMKKYNVQIGFHTKTHADLRKLDEIGLKNEIEISKEELEFKLGKKLIYFAYPRGFYSPKIIASVQNSGFEAAFTVDGGGYASSSRYTLHRIGLEGNVSDWEFASITSPLGIAVERMLMSVLKFKENLL